MRYTARPSKSSRQIDASPRDSSVGRDGVSMAPPESGIDFVDRGVVQRIENRTGLPDGLKAGIERLSGLSMGDVRVHYNSSKPAQLQALAYTQGTDIHVASDQERHLPHEAWHVVQQKQGRVRPLIQAQEVSINYDVGLEHEADVMGNHALHMTPGARATSGEQRTVHKRSNLENIPIQLKIDGFELRDVGRFKGMMFYLYIDKLKRSLFEAYLRRKEDWTLEEFLSNIGMHIGAPREPIVKDVPEEPERQPQAPSPLPAPASPLLIANAPWEEILKEKKEKERQRRLREMGVTIEDLPEEPERQPQAPSPLPVPASPLLIANAPWEEILVEKEREAREERTIDRREAIPEGKKEKQENKIPESDIKKAEAEILDLRKLVSDIYDLAKPFESYVGIGEDMMYVKNSWKNLIQALRQFKKSNLSRQALQDAISECEKSVGILSDELVRAVAEAKQEFDQVSVKSEYEPYKPPPSSMESASLSKEKKFAERYPDAILIGEDEWKKRLNQAIGPGLEKIANTAMKDERSVGAQWPDADRISHWTQGGSGGGKTGFVAHVNDACFFIAYGSHAGPNVYNISWKAGAEGSFSGSQVTI